MRYASSESPIVPAVLPSGGTATVQILHQDANVLMALSSNAAVESALPGVWQFNLAALVDPPEGYAQLVVAFTHSTGEKDYAKITVHGVMDDIKRTLKLVQTI